MKKKLLNKEEVKRVLDILKELYPEAVSELNYSNPFELLIAVILSAQCTDKRVNQVTEGLFKAFKTPKEYLTLSVEELGVWIKSCGFYNSKSKNILETCRILVEEYAGEIPTDREKLMELPGVGRKTANVVVSNVFGQPAIAVDTHVFRVSNRIGLAAADNVKDTEMQLMKRIPKILWSEAHHWIIYHGRRVCKARRTLCTDCPLTDYCLYYRGMEG